MNYDKNIFWSDIPKEAKIYDLGSSYVVHMPDGTKGLVFWTGSDSVKAQDFLRSRALPKNVLDREELLRKVESDAEQKVTNLGEEEFQKLLSKSVGHERVALLRKAADQLSNNPTHAHTMYQTSRRIAGLRAAATRLEKKLKG